MCFGPYVPGLLDAFAYGHSVRTFRPQTSIHRVARGDLSASRSASFFLPVRVRTLPNHTSHATQSIYSRPQLSPVFLSRVGGSGSLVQGYLRVYCPDSDIFLVTLGCCGSDIGHLYRRVCLRSQVWGSKAALFYVNGGFFNSHTRTTRVE